jgi:hypothetical protein
LEGFDDIFEFAFHDEVDLVEVFVDAVVGDSVLREVVGADFFASVAGANLTSSGIEDFFLFDFLIVSGDSGTDNGKCFFSVLGLTAFVLALGGALYRNLPFIRCRVLDGIHRKNPKEDHSPFSSEPCDERCLHAVAIRSEKQPTRKCRHSASTWNTHLGDENNLPSRSLDHLGTASIYGVGQLRHMLATDNHVSQHSLIRERQQSPSGLRLQRMQQLHTQNQSQEFRWDLSSSHSSIRFPCRSFGFLG